LHCFSAKRRIISTISHRSRYRRPEKAGPIYLEFPIGITENDKAQASTIKSISLAADKNKRFAVFCHISQNHIGQPANARPLPLQPAGSPPPAANHILSEVFSYTNDYTRIAPSLKYSFGVYSCLIL
jgi:hypothetical protein